MTQTSEKQPSAREALDLHARLLLPDDMTAPSELAVAYLDRLAAWLMAHNSRADPDDCTTAAGDAILRLIKRPATYKPARQALEVYLRLSAQGRLKNLLRAERRHGARRASLEAVEHSPVMGKYLWDAESDPARILQAQEVAQAAAGALRPIPRAVQAGLTPQEAKVLELMRGRERRTALYAAALGITHDPLDAQRRAVKRIKDRLSKRLERAEERDAQPD